MYHKTFVGTPYYRQESGMFQLGVKLPRETMANWYIQGAGKYFFPLFERMHELLIQRDLIHADETTCQVLREEGKAAESISYMWIYLSGKDGLPPIILYDYQSGRAGKYAQQFLECFHGMLHKWDSKYPKIYKSWHDNWATLSTYFKYPEAVRRLIYTTNAIEGFNRQLRKVTKSKNVFP